MIGLALVSRSRDKELPLHRFWSRKLGVIALAKTVVKRSTLDDTNKRSICMWESSSEASRVQGRILQDSLNLIRFDVEWIFENSCNTTLNTYTRHPHSTPTLDTLKLVDSYIHVTVFFSTTLCLTTARCCCRGSGDLIEVLEYWRRSNRKLHLDFHYYSGSHNLFSLWLADRGVFLPSFLPSLQSVEAPLCTQMIKVNFLSYFQQGS